MASDAPWTGSQLRDQLAHLNVSWAAVIPIRVTGADLDPSRARTRLRSRLVGIAAVVIFAAIIAASLLQAAREGFTTGSVVLVLLLGSQIALVWFGAPTIIGPVVPGSEAARFVEALLKPTTVFRTVKRRWLLLGDPDRQLIATQEQGWMTTGPHQNVELRWSDHDGRIVTTEPTPAVLRNRLRLQFADDSTVTLQLTRTALRALDKAIGRGSTPQS